MRVFDIIFVFVLLIQCWLLRLVRGKANIKKERVRRVLIVQNGKLGDMVCTTPVFRALKKHIPECAVTVLGNRVNRNLLMNHPDVDGYVVFDHTLALKATLIAGNYDVALITIPDFFSLAVLYLSKIPFIVTPVAVGGYTPLMSVSYRLLRRIAINVPHHVRQYAPREYLNLLTPLGIDTEETKKTLRYSEDAQNHVLAWYREHAIDVQSACIIGLTPSAGNKVKIWPADRFAAVADYLVERFHAYVIVIGGEKDRAEIRDMMERVRHTERIIDTCELFSIDQLKYLVRTFRLMIGSDTGPIYVAEAFGVPTVDIVGPVDENDQPPRGDIHRVVVPLRKRSELYLLNSRRYNFNEARRQTESITVEMVVREIEALASVVNISSL